METKHVKIFLASSSELKEDPNADRDGDGVPDRKDDCPDEPGKVTGCPDGDQDGVIDKNDKCPEQAGTITNYGCPEIDLEEKRQALRARIESVIKEKRSDVARVSKQGRELNNPQIDEYIDLITKDYLDLSKRTTEQIKGSEDFTSLADRYRKEVDKMIRELEQYIKKVEAEAGNSPSLQNLIIAAGQTYIVKQNQELEVDQWVMEKGAIIKFSEGVTSFKLSARTVDISYGARIEGVGKNGVRGKNGNPGKNGIQCKPEGIKGVRNYGTNGEDGSNGTKGTDGVDITLVIGEIKSFESLDIVVNGGNGDDGGKGGNGGAGSAAVGDGENCKCGPYNGGSGGAGGNGGNAGRGGDVIIESLKEYANRRTDDFKKLEKQIRIRNDHGKPGQAGQYGNGGFAGDRKGYAACPPARSGAYGANGKSGASPERKEGTRKFIDNR